MAALCLTTGTVAVTLALSSFTLSWTHSIEKVEWREDWRIEGGLLMPVAAWVRGSGTGMDPGADAVLIDGWWRYRPEVGAQEQLALARSPFAEDYRLCWGGGCRPLGDIVPLPARPDVTIVRPCPGHSRAR